MVIDDGFLTDPVECWHWGGIVPQRVGDDKVAGGSRSEKGAKAWSILASVIRTAPQQDKLLIATIETLLWAAWADQEPPTLRMHPDLCGKRRITTDR